MLTGAGFISKSHLPVHGHGFSGSRSSAGPEEWA